MKTLYSRDKFDDTPIPFVVYYSPSTTTCWQSSSRKRKIFMYVLQQKKLKLLLKNVFLYLEKLISIISAVFKQ